MVDELPDRNARSELGHAAEVIAVPVGGDQVIDAAEAGILDRGHDPVRIPRRRRPAVAGVDQHRLSGRRDEQGGVAALDVDDIDLEILGGARLRRGMADDDHQSQQESAEPPHHGAPPCRHGALPALTA